MLLVRLSSSLAADALRRSRSSAIMMDDRNWSDPSIAARSSPEPATPRFRIPRVEVQSVSSLSAVEPRRSPNRRKNVFLVELCHNLNRLDQLPCEDDAGWIAAGRIRGEPPPTQFKSSPSASSLRFTHRIRLVSAHKLNAVVRRSRRCPPRSHSPNTMPEPAFGSRSFVVCAH
jgi:hypothetical protein